MSTPKTKQYRAIMCNREFQHIWIEMNHGYHLAMNRSTHWNPRCFSNQVCWNINISGWKWTFKLGPNKRWATYYWLEPRVRMFWNSNVLETRIHLDWNEPSNWLTPRVGPYITHWNWNPMCFPSEFVGIGCRIIWLYSSS